MQRPPRRYLTKLSGLAVRLGSGEIQRCQVNEGRQLCCNCRGGNFSDYRNLSNKRAHKMVPSEAALKNKFNVSNIILPMLSITRLTIIRQEQML